MRALTLTCPWAHAVAHWGKNIENRTWAPPRALIGDRIAIHAGKSPFRQNARGDWQCNALDELQVAIDFAEKAGATIPKPLTPRWLHERSSAILCVATIAGWIGDTADEWSANGREPDDLAAMHAARRERSLWFVGPYGWILRAVVTLAEPVPCKGAQGLWTVPPDVEALVEAQLRRR